MFFLHRFCFLCVCFVGWKVRFRGVIAGVCFWARSSERKGFFSNLSLILTCKILPANIDSDGQVVWLSRYFFIALSIRLTTYRVMLS